MCLYSISYTEKTLIDFIRKTQSSKSTCWGPAPAGSRGYPQDEWRRREKARETSLDRAKSQDEWRERERERETRRGCLQQGLAVLYFLLQLLYPKLVHFYREDSLTLRQLIIHKTRVYSGYFFVYESLVYYLLALGPINILCRSGECKPIFHFCGDLN